MGQMQRVNVFAEYPNGETFYRSGVFPKHKTVYDVMSFYHLPTTGVKIFANSAPATVEIALSELKTGLSCFLSFIYLRTEPAKRTKQ